MAFFVPIHLDIGNEIIVEKPAINVIPEPSHDICSIVIGPDVSGVFSFDWNIIKFGDSQPDAHPWAIVKKFTKCFV